MLLTVVVWILVVVWCRVVSQHGEHIDKQYMCVSLCAAYPPLYPNFPASAMDTPLKYHEQELSYAGIDLKQLLNSGKKVGTPAGYWLSARS